MRHDSWGVLPENPENISQMIYQKSPGSSGIRNSDLGMGINALTFYFAVALRGLKEL